MKLSSVKKIASGLVRVAIAICLVFFIIVWFFMGHFLFVPEVLDKNTPLSFAHPFEEKWVNVNGVQIHSLLFKEPVSKGLILYFHGNGGSLRSWGFVGSGFAGATQRDVWIMDYQGYGKSEGKIESENQLFELAEIFWQEALKIYPPEKIIIYGRSLGTAIAVDLASRHQSAGLVLESPFYSVASMVTSKIPFYPTVFVPFPMRSDLRIQKVKSPIIILHGGDDEVIPFTQGERLAALVPQAEFVKIPRGQHNDLSDHQEFNQALSRWFSSK